jgi:hypothetical protein
MKEEGRTGWRKELFNDHFELLMASELISYRQTLVNLVVLRR